MMIYYDDMNDHFFFLWNDYSANILDIWSNKPYPPFSNLLTTYYIWLSLDGWLYYEWIYLSSSSSSSLSSTSCLLNYESVYSFLSISSSTFFIILFIDYNSSLLFYFYSLWISLWYFYISSIECLVLTTTSDICYDSFSYYWFYWSNSSWYFYSSIFPLSFIYPHSWFTHGYKYLPIAYYYISHNDSK